MSLETPMLSVVIPAYNEEENLAPLLEELVSVLQGVEQPYEIIVVNDGSSDGTEQKLESLRSDHPYLRPIHLSRNTGQTGAFDAGFRTARGDIIVTLDADLQYESADIPRLLSHLDSFDVICGARRERKDSLLRRLSSRIANVAVRVTLGSKVTDIGCSLKVFRKEHLERLPLFEGLHRFLPILLEWNGRRIMEIAVQHRPRRAGESKYTIRNRMCRALADLLAMLWIRSRWLRYEIKS